MGVSWQEVGLISIAKPPTFLPRISYSMSEVAPTRILPHSHALQMVGRQEESPSLFLKPLNQGPPLFLPRSSLPWTSGFQNLGCFRLTHRAWENLQRSCLHAGHSDSMADWQPEVRLLENVRPVTLSYCSGPFIDLGATSLPMHCSLRGEAAEQGAKSSPVSGLRPG